MAAEVPQRADGSPRPILNPPTLAARAEELLGMPIALSELTVDEARCAVRDMRLVSHDAGAALSRRSMLRLLDDMPEVAARSEQ